jgi:hypothetical protein
LLRGALELSPTQRAEGEESIEHHL